jgi:dUTP pyrophosphatase
MNDPKVDVKIKFLGRNVTYPYYATQGSSGCDIVASIEKTIIIGPHMSQLIPTGIALAIPPGFEVQVRPRSGLALKNQITVLNAPGTIDADYRGEINVILINHGHTNFEVEPYMKIAQLVLCPISRINFVEVIKLDPTDRNDAGFGHSGY